MLKKSLFFGIAVLVASIGIIACGDGAGTPVDRTAANADAEKFKAAEASASLAAASGDMKITLDDISGDAPEGTLKFKTISLDGVSISVNEVVIDVTTPAVPTVTIPTANLVAASALSDGEDLIIGFTSTLNGVESEVYTITIDDSDHGTEMAKVILLKTDYDLIKAVGNLSRVVSNSTKAAAVVTNSPTSLHAGTDIEGAELTVTYTEGDLFDHELETVVLSVGSTSLKIVATDTGATITAGGSGSATFSGLLTNSNYKAAITITVAITTE
jgi:hypothetical protein